MSQRKSRAQTRAEDRILEITSRADVRRKKVPSNLPDPYLQLLSEASDPSRLNGPPAKRRKVGGGHRPAQAAPSEVIDLDAETRGATHSNPQTVIDSDESAGESDFDWEEVEVSPARGNASDTAAPDEVAAVSVEVAATAKSPRPKRKGVTAVERALARDAHKVHVLCLLFNAHVRNRWCNLAQVETNLTKIPSSKIINLLHPNTSWIQLRQSDSFLEGLKLVTALWQSKFKVTASGLRKARWEADVLELDKLKDAIHSDYETLDKTKFIAASRTLKGSQDLGNILFCALLRAIGVEARLVCSLQPLPLTMVSVKPTTPQKARPVKPRVYATFESDQETASSADEGLINGVKPLGRPQRKIGQVELGGPIGSYQQEPLQPKRNKKVQRLDYPVFWVEALNPAYQQWVVVDPVVTNSVARASKLEPPASYEPNVMSYVIAFDEDGTARDVTRRYCKAYNAKTRKLRIESTTDGQKWWSSATRPFKRRMRLDRDQIEDAELSRKEAAEGLPNNIQDFKDHPNYALERHLKRNEIIWPKREIGKINAGKSSTSNLEPIYRRSDVQTVQNADKWYRFGREIKHGEQPLKRVRARTRRDRSPESDDNDGTSDVTGLYSFAQTEPYVPPPVLHGKVPRNVYGNIDIYVPSMIPAGGAHVKHDLAKRAAQLMGVDYADAVTGFKFQGRHGTAVVQGIVVSLEYREAVQLIIDGFEQSVRDDEDAIRSAECLRLWRKFLLGLEIAQRIGLTDIYAKDGEKARKFKEELEMAAEEQEETMDAGGFLQDADDGGNAGLVRDTRRQAEQVDSTTSEARFDRGAVSRRKRRLVEDDDSDDGHYDPSAISNGGEVEIEDEQDTLYDHAQEQPKTAADDSEETAGGFTVDDNNEDDGESSPTQDTARARRLDKQPNETPRKISNDQVYHADTEVGDFPANQDQQIFSASTTSDDNDGGGFIVEDDHEANTAQTNDDGAGGGFVIEDDDATIIMPTANGIDEQGGGFMVDDEEEDEDSSKAVSATVSLAESNGRIVVESSSESDDNGSMLSHDPEDEDADPDWLDAA